MVEHSTTYPEIEGSNLATIRRREEIANCKKYSLVSLELKQLLFSLASKQTQRGYLFIGSLESYSQNFILLVTTEWVQ